MREGIRWLSGSCFTGRFLEISTTPQHKKTMNTAIEMLRDAAKKVSDATGELFIYAGIEIRHGGEAEFSIYRIKTHKASTLDDAVAKAIAYSPRESKLERALELRKEADQLEKEAA